MAENLDRLFDGISCDCKNCKYIDCRGYVWLHPCEVKEISTVTDTVTINGKIVFIDSFTREDSKIDPGRFQPPCRLRDCRGRCLIQGIKPVVCMLYPLNLRMIGGELWLVLNEDCLFVDNLKKRGGLKRFTDNIRLLWDRLGNKFRNDLIDTFKEVDAVSSYPTDYHNEIIKIIRIC